MREKDEITGLFRSRLSGTEMTVRDGFWEQLQEDAASPAAGRKRAIVLSPKYYRVAAAASVIFMGHRTKRILRIERKEYQTY